MQKFIIILIVNWYDDTATCVTLNTQNYMQADIEQKEEEVASKLSQFTAI